MVVEGSKLLGYTRLGAERGTKEGGKRNAMFRMYGKDEFWVMCDVQQNVLWGLKADANGTFLKG